MDAGSGFLDGPFKLKSRGHVGTVSKKMGV